MKKRTYISALLMSGLLLSTGFSVTSCKDYDDDISALQNKDTDLATKLDQQKTDLEAKIAEAKTNAEQAQAAIDAAKKAADEAAQQYANAKTEAEKVAADAAASKAAAEQAQAAAEKAANDAKAQAAEGAKAALADLEKKLNDLASQTITKDDLDKAVSAAVAPFSGQLEGIEKDLSDLQAFVKDYDKTKETLASVQQDLATQIDALKKYKDEIAALKIGDRLGSLEGQAKDAAKAIEALQGKADQAATDIQKIQDDLSKKADASTVETLRTDMENAKKSLGKYFNADGDQSLEATISTIQGNITTLHTLLSLRLTSLNLIPELYTDGIETIGLENLTWNEIVNDENGNAIIGGSFERGLNLPAWVKYRLNPSGVNENTVDLSKLAFIDQLAISRAADGASDKLQIIDPKFEDGVLKFGVKSDEFDITDAGDKILTASLRVPLKGDALTADEKKAGAPVYVYSDFAAVTREHVKSLFYISDANANLFNVGKNVAADLKNTNTTVDPKAAPYITTLFPKTKQTAILEMVANDGKGLPNAKGGTINLNQYFELAEWKAQVTSIFNPQKSNDVSDKYNYANVIKRDGQRFKDLGFHFEYSIPEPKDVPDYKYPSSANANSTDYYTPQDKVSVTKEGELTIKEGAEGTAPIVRIQVKTQKGEVVTEAYVRVKIANAGANQTAPAVNCYPGMDKATTVKTAAINMKNLSAGSALQFTNDDLKSNDTRVQVYKDGKTFGPETGYQGGSYSIGKLVQDGGDAFQAFELDYAKLTGLTERAQEYKIVFTLKKNNNIATMTYTFNVVLPHISLAYTTRWQDADKGDDRNIFRAVPEMYNSEAGQAPGINPAIGDKGLVDYVTNLKNDPFLTTNGKMDIKSATVPEGYGTTTDVTDIVRKMYDLDVYTDGRQIGAKKTDAAVGTFDASRSFLYFDAHNNLTNVSKFLNQIIPTVTNSDGSYNIKDGVFQFSDPTGKAIIPAEVCATFQGAAKNATGIVRTFNVQYETPFAIAGHFGKWEVADLYNDDQSISILDLFKNSNEMFLPFFSDYITKADVKDAFKAPYDQFYRINKGGIAFDIDDKGNIKARTSLNRTSGDEKQDENYGSGTLNNMVRLTYDPATYKITYRNLGSRTGTQYYIYIQAKVTSPYWGTIYRPIRITVKPNVGK